MKNDSDRNKPVRIVSQIEERIVNSVKKTVQYGEHSLSLETGKIARQAGGAVIASLGETSVMVTVVGTACLGTSLCKDRRRHAVGLERSEQEVTITGAVRCLRRRTVLPGAACILPIDGFANTTTSTSINDFELVAVGAVDGDLVTFLHVEPFAALALTNEEVYGFRSKLNIKGLSLEGLGVRARRVGKA